MIWRIENEIWSDNQLVRVVYFRISRWYFQYTCFTWLNLGIETRRTGWGKMP